MELLRRVRGLHEALLRFVGEDGPSLPWTLRRALGLLHTYSNGLTEPLLLAELEGCWSKERQRADGRTKLHQVLLKAEALDPLDVFAGTILVTDSLMHQLVDDEGVVVRVFPHRQLHDFGAYLKAQGSALFASRDSDGRIQHTLRFLITRCRAMLADDHSLVLLLSESTVPVLDYANPNDRSLVDKCLLPLHSAFHADMTPSETKGLFVEVLHISPAHPYPGGAFSAQFKVIKLRVLPDGFPAASEVCGRITFLILYDDALQSSALLKEGQLLLVYRPFIMSNEQEVLFGRVEDHTSEAFSHVKVTARCEVLRALTADCSPPDLSLLPFHLLLGCTTVVCVVSNLLLTSAKQSAAVDERRAAVADRYQARVSDAFLDVTRSPLLFDPADALPHMLGVSLVAQLVRREPHCLVLRPAPGTSRSSSSPCKTCSLGEFFLSTVSVSADIGDLLYLSGLQIASVSSAEAQARGGASLSGCTGPGGRCARVTSVRCALASNKSRSYESASWVCNLSRLVSLAVSPSLFPPLSLRALAAVDDSIGVHVVHAYIAKPDELCAGAPTGVGETFPKRHKATTSSVVLFDGTGQMRADVSSSLMALTPFDQSCLQQLAFLVTLSKSLDQSEYSLVIHVIAEINPSNSAMAYRKRLKELILPIKILV